MILFAPIPWMATQSPCVSLTGITPFSELLKDAKDFDFVVACGGDGTIATISYELRNTNIPILPFPAGTANLLAMNLLSPSEPHALTKLADQANTMLFDLGEIECKDSKVGFTMMAGCGYDQLIMSNARRKKRLLGPIAYFEAALTTLHLKFQSSPSLSMARLYKAQVSA